VSQVGVFEKKRIPEYRDKGYNGDRIDQGKGIDIRFL
jgi:hypothetical protein